MLMQTLSLSQESTFISRYPTLNDQWGDLIWILSLLKIWILLIYIPEYEPIIEPPTPERKAPPNKWVY